MQKPKVGERFIMATPEEIKENELGNKAKILCRYVRKIAIQ